MDKNKCSSCGEAPHECSCKNKEFTKAVIEIDNPEQITLMRKVVIPASMGDDTAVPPVVGKYKNVLLFYEANSKSYLYSSDGIPTLLANGLTDYEQAVNLPEINGVTLLGNKSGEDLGLQDKLVVGDGIDIDSDNTISISDIEQYAHFFDTVTDMKAATNLVAGDYARTLGYYAKDDMGGACYKITDTGTANEMDVIAVGTGLYANLILEDTVNVKQFGAYGDNTHDDTIVFQSAIDKAYEAKIKVINIPEGIYLISQPLEIYENKNYDLDFNYSNERHADIGYPVSKLVFQGSDQYNTMIKATAGSYLFNGYATTPTGIQDVTFNDLYFNGNDIAESTFQMNIVHFGGREIQFHRCTFNSFTKCAVEDWMTQAMINSAPLRNQLRLLIDDCFIGNNKNGLIVGGDDTIINHTQISKNEEFGIIVKANVHMMTISECKIQYNGQSKTGYNGGQIKFECAGNTVNLTNNYIENKSGNYDVNDTGVLIFAPNTADPSALNLYNLNIKNSYINVSGAPCLGERIGNCVIVGINLKDNEITNIYSDKPYLFLTLNDYLNTGGLSQNFRCNGNYVNARTASGTHTAVTYFYLFNETSYGRSGSVKAEFGLWSPNTTQDLRNTIPTIISGMIGADGYTQYKKLGDYDISKTGTGIYEITFTRPAAQGDLTATQATNYPVIVQMKFANGLDFARITNRSVNGFHVETGTYNSEGTSFTAADKAFEFIATYMSEA